MTAAASHPAGNGQSAEFLGLHFDRLTQDEALARVVELAQGKSFSYVVTPNVDHLVGLEREAADTTSNGAGPVWQAYEAAALRLCDSRILALLANRSGIRLPVVPGSDLTARLLTSPAIAGWRIALVGGTPAQLAWLEHERPDCLWLQHAPPMGVRKNVRAQDEIIAFLAAAQPQLVLFAIGAPQSELVASRAALSGTCQGVGLCIGASIEFLTGEKRRAPLLWQKLHLEWAFRLLCEPRRLWRRYLIDGPRIFAIWRRWEKQRPH